MTQKYKIACCECLEMLEAETDPGKEPILMLCSECDKLIRARAKVAADQEILAEMERALLDRLYSRCMKLMIDSD